MKIVPVVFAIAALAACNRPDPVAENANNVEALPTVNEPAPNPTGAPPANAAEAQGSVPATAGRIPVAVQGRWGLTPGDCTSIRGDTKGLLVVSADRLQVYESRAISDGPYFESAKVFPAMFTAALQGFPNPPQGPRKVNIQISNS